MEHINYLFLQNRLSHDITLTAEIEELKSLLVKVKEESEKFA